MRRIMCENCGLAPADLDGDRLCDLCRNPETARRLSAITTQETPMPSETRPPVPGVTVAYREREPFTIAMCDCQGCPWKFRGIDLAATKMQAEAHVRASLHTVSLSHDQRMQVVPHTKYPAVTFGQSVEASAVTGARER